MDCKIRINTYVGFLRNSEKYCLSLICGALVLLFAQCNSTDNSGIQTEKEKLISIINQIKEKPIRLPDSVMFIYRDSLYNKNIFGLHKGKKIKITTKIYGDCHVCVHTLNTWKEEIIPLIDTSKVALYFYLSIKKIYGFRSGLYKDIELDFPLIIDTADYYLRENGFEAIDQEYTTFLLNKNNDAVLIGSPVHNESLKKLYISKIKELIGNYE